jgi:hypothetical protein
MIDHDLAKTRTALNVARRVRLAADGQTAMEEYEAKRSAAYENAERLRSLRHARDAAEANAGEAVAKMPIRRKPRVESRLKRGA